MSNAASAAPIKSVASKIAVQPLLDIDKELVIAFYELIHNAANAIYQNGESNTRIKDASNKTIIASDKTPLILFKKQPAPAWFYGWFAGLLEHVYNK